MRATPTVTKTGIEILACAVVSTAAATPAFAQSYTVTEGSGSFSSIAAIGTPLGLSGVDDGAASFNAPAAFPFFGQTVSAGTSIYVNSNGTVHVGASFSDYSNTTLPSSGGPSNFVAPFWTDLRFNSTDAYWALSGTEVVIEWDRVESFSVSGETISFQVRFAANGTIRFVYGPRVAGAGWSGATIGAEDATETRGVMASCGSACTPSSVPSGRVVTLTPGMGPPPSGGDLLVFGGNSPGTVTAGGVVSVPFLVENLGPGSTAATRVSLFLGPSSPVSASDIEAASMNVPPLSPGQSFEDILSLTVPAIPGTFGAGLIVDPQDAVTEPDESNNLYDLGTVTITGGGMGGITITTREIPPAVVGIPYDVVLQTSGGTSPVFSVVEGQLPSGVTLSGSGRLSGTPTAEGAFFFAVEAREPNLTPGQASYELVVNNGGMGGITVTPTSLPDARVGVPYTGALSATGGAPPYAFQVISGRPEWLSVNAQGMLTGTPDGPGEHAMTVSVFDSELADSTAVVTLRVLESGPVGLVASLPAGVTGRPYAQPVIRGGIPPYQATILDGSFPEGFGVDDQGVLRGTATTAGRWQVTLQVTDSNTPQGMAAGAVILEVSELQPLEITVDSLVVPTFTQADVAIPVQGGIPPYAWSIVQGALPAGLTFDAEGGRILGEIEDVTTSTITFRVQDSDGEVAERPIVVATKRQRSVEGGGAGRGGGRGGCVCVGEPAGVPAGAAWALLGVGLLVAGRRPRRVPRGSEPRRPGRSGPD